MIDMNQKAMTGRFQKFAHHVSDLSGRPSAFVLSVSLILIWAACGPAHNYSDTWQLIVNTSTTIITFLMVFLIQNTQNRDARAIHLKLDELIRASSHARNNLIDLQNLNDDELDSLHLELCKLKEKTAHKLEQVETIKKAKKGHHHV